MAAGGVASDLGGGWMVQRWRGTAAELHGRPLDELTAPTVHVLDAVAPALVLGSTQPVDDVDAAACAAAGVDVVRRRSGGGAVLVGPGEAAWVDVELPRGHRHFDDDVGRATWWLGERWSRALAALGVAAPTVHRASVVCGPWARQVCFAGLAPGEVTDGPGGPKVLGISQRRTRAGARFQCAVVLRWEPARLAALLALDEAARSRLVDELATVAAVPAGATASSVVVEAFLDELRSAP